MKTSVCPSCHRPMLVPAFPSGVSVSCPHCGQVLVVRADLLPNGWKPKPQSTAIPRLCTGLLVATIIMALLAAAAALACRLDLADPSTPDRLAMIRKVTGAAISAAALATILGLLALLLAAAKKGRPVLAALFGFIGSVAAAGFAFTTDRIGRTQAPAIALPAVANSPEPARQPPPLARTPAGQSHTAVVTPAAMVGEFELDLQLTIQTVAKPVIDEFILKMRIDPATSGDRLARFKRMAEQKIAEAFPGRSVNIKIDGNGNYELYYEFRRTDGHNVLKLAGHYLFRDGAVDLLDEDGMVGCIKFIGGNLAFVPHVADLPHYLRRVQPEPK